MLDAIAVVSPIEISAPIAKPDQSVIVQEQPHKPIIRIPEMEVKPLVKVPMSATEEPDHQQKIVKGLSLLVAIVMMMFLFMK